MFKSAFINRLLEPLYTYNERVTSHPKIIIPYGKHSYGPQPELITNYLPALVYKAQGSKVGKFCSISSGLRFTFYGKHNYQWVSTYPFYAFYQKWKYNDGKTCYESGKLVHSRFKPAPIIIENDVWIASNVTIMEDVTIGNGAVLAMDSLVTKNVPPYAIVGGKPAQIIKYRFNDQQIGELLKIAWWDWTDEEITKFLPLILSDDIEGFIEAAERK
jgi:acetyltransferase-like isoleucine patch superfamily enzyme